MSLIEPDFVQGVAEGLGIKPTDDAAKTLAPDVEYRLREIVQEAEKFARHAKRTYITPDDINQAFRLRNVEPIYGMSSTTDPSRFVRAAGQLDIVYAEDPVVPLSTILEQPLPSAPWEAGVTVHWLAVNGKQPTIPENMPLMPPTHRDKRQRTEAAKQPPQALVAPPEAAPAAAATPAVAGIGVEGATTTTATPHTTPASAALGPAAAPGGAHVEEGSLVRAPLKHVVSKELHLYYNKVTSTLDKAAPPPAPPSPELLAVLSSLHKDAGLQPLAPYLAHFIAESVANNISSVPRLHLILRAAVSMGSNPLLDFGPYLHQIMPALLTCLLAKTIGSSTTDENGNSNAVTGYYKNLSKKERQEAAELNPDALHWSVRDEAAKAVAAFCKTYPDAAPRVQRQLLAALSASSSTLQTRYGAVVGLDAQGPRAVRALLLPNLIPAVAAVYNDVAGRTSAYQRLAMDAVLKVRGALLASAGYCVYLSGVCAPWSVGGEVQQKRKERNGDAAAAVSNGNGKRKKVTDGAAAVKPRLAKMSREEAEAAVANAGKLNRSGSNAGRGGRGRGRGRGGAAAGRKQAGGAAAGTAAEQPVALEEVFGDDKGEEGEENPAAAAEAEKEAQAWLNKLPPGVVMRTASNVGGASGDHGGGAAGAREVLDVLAHETNIPAENYLAEAWREDFPVEKMRQAMEELFGSDVAPYEENSGSSLKKVKYNKKDGGDSGDGGANEVKDGANEAAAFI